MNAASSSITVNGDYFITADFEETAPIQYNLIISSTSGGLVTTPGEDALRRDAGTMVDLVAKAEESHRFVNRIVDVDTVAGVNAASPTGTIDGNTALAEKTAIVGLLVLVSVAAGCVGNEAARQRS